MMGFPSRVFECRAINLIGLVLLLAGLVSANLEDGLINVVVSLPSGESVALSSCILVTVNDNVRCSGDNPLPEDGAPCNPMLAKQYFENVTFEDDSAILPVSIKVDNLTTSAYEFDISIVLNNGWCHNRDPYGDWIRSGDYLNSMATIAYIGNGINETSVVLTLESLIMTTTPPPTTGTTTSEPKGCVHNGTMFAPGATRMEECNLCLCGNGYWGCTLMACLNPVTPPPQPEPTTKGVCFYNGKEFSEGETRKMDCNSCLCDDGQWACTEMVCLQPTPEPEAKYTPSAEPESEYTSTAKPEAEYTPSAEPGAEYTPSAEPESEYTSTAKPEAGYTPSAEPESEYTSTANPEAGYTPSAEPEAEYTPVPDPEHFPTTAQSGCEHNGKIYKPKEKRLSDDGCNTCFCGETGVWGCTLMACPPQKKKVCIHEDKEIQEGSSVNVDCNNCLCSGGQLACTKKACVLPEPETTPEPEGYLSTAKPFCMHNGKLYKTKETRLADDGCNHCFCGGNGVWGCTLMACLPRKKDICKYNGLEYKIDEKFQDDNDACVNCICLPGTPPKVACSTVMCAKPPCSNTIKSPKVCCDVCPHKNISACHQKLREANELLSSEPPMVGVYIPSCNERGEYNPVQCQSSDGMCWCSDPDGNEIEGTRSRDEPKCGKAPLSKCQQHLSKTNSPMPRVGAYLPQCDSNGDYSTVQCHASTAYCWCVNSEGVEIPGTRVRGQPSCKKGVVLEGSIKFRSAALSGTQYNSCLIINIQPNIFCDEPPEGETSCDIPMVGTAKYNDPEFKDGVFSYAMIFEQRNYRSFAISSTLNVGWCADKDSKSWIRAGDYLNTYSHTFNYNSGKQRIIKDITIDPYKHNREPNKLRSAPRLSECQVQKQKAMLLNSEMPIVGAFIPQCEDNGEFSSVQCNGSTGFCWCVDNSGKEIANTRIIGKPDCTAKPISKCQTAKSAAEKPSPGGLPLLGAFIPQCETDGSYAKMQCHENYCWCVDTDGKELKDTKQRGKVNCAAGLKASSQLTECQLQKQKAMPLNSEMPIVGAFIPQCEDNGEFSSVQCHGSTGFCWCVDNSGKEIANTRIIGKPDCTAKKVNRPSKCQLHRTDSLERSIDSNGMPLLDVFIPDCQPNGKYAREQCWSSLNTCWCVDSEGKEIKDTRVKGTTPQCGAKFLINGTISFYPNNPSQIPNNSCLVVRLEKDEPCPTESPNCLGTLIAKQNYTEPILHNRQLRYNFGLDEPISGRMIIRLVLNMGWCHLAGAQVPFKNYDYVNHVAANFTMDTSERISVQNIYFRLVLPPLPTPEPEPVSKCYELRRKAQKTINDKKPIVGVFMPKCEPNGEFSPMQCHGSTGQCWCADKDGSEIPKTRVRGRPFCGKAHFEGNVTFSKDAPATLPKKSCLTISIRENMLCTDAEPCSVPLVAKLTYKDPAFKNGRFKFTLHPDVFPPGLYQVSGVLNVGWCQQEGDDKWIRSGDYLNEFAHEFKLAAGQLSVRKELELDQYFERKPQPTTANVLDPCRTKKCRNDTVCVKSATGLAECVCNRGCPFIYAPVCGTNDKNYDNDCLMGVDACIQNETITVKNRGECVSPTEEPKKTCDKILCRAGARCAINDEGISSCICRRECPLKFDPVCGSDGMSYPNKCALELSACEQKTNISVVNRGDCPIPKDPCDEFNCTQGKVCIADENSNPSCVCQRGCPLNFDPVCGNDGTTYPNMCSLNSVSCERNITITALHVGECKPKESENEHVVNGMIMMSDINDDIVGDACLSVIAEDVSLADAPSTVLAEKKYNISAPWRSKSYQLKFSPFPETNIVSIVGQIYNRTCGTSDQKIAQYTTDTMFNAYLSDRKKMHYVDVKLVRAAMPAAISLCYDDTGIEHEVNQRWTSPSDPCSVCICDKNGKKQCETIYCDVVTCNDAFIKEGDCCPSCPAAVDKKKEIVVDGMIMMPDTDNDIVGDACLSVIAEDVSLADAPSTVLARKKYNISAPWSPKSYQLNFVPVPAVGVVAISAEITQGLCYELVQGKSQYFTDTNFNLYLSDKQKKLYYKDVKVVKTVDSPRISVCIDQNAVRRTINESWTNPKDVCSMCSCDGYGQTQCEQISCNVVMCDNAIIKDGDCCPSCPDNLPLGCADEEGMLHKANESWTHTKDKCQMCSCDQMGVAQCSKIYCGVPACDDYELQEGACCPSCPVDTTQPMGDYITVNGMIIMSDTNAQLTGDACLRVFAEDVSIADAVAIKLDERRYNISRQWKSQLYRLEFAPIVTTRIVGVSAQIVEGSCDKPEIGNPQYFTDTIFNIDLSDKQPPAYYKDVKLVKYIETAVWFGCTDQSGIQRMMNETWTNAKDVCSLCSCVDTVQSRCAKINCGVALCANAVIKEGSCCPSCPEIIDQCLDDSGLIHSANDVWVDPVDPCKHCSCQENGTIVCSVVYCGVPTCKGAFTKEGHCCPGCPESHTVEGMVMLPDPSVMFVNNSCLYVYAEDVSLADTSAEMLGKAQYVVSGRWSAQPYSIEFTPYPGLVVGRVAASLYNGSCSSNTLKDESYFTDTIFSFRMSNSTIKKHYTDVKLVKYEKPKKEEIEVGGSVSFPKPINLAKDSCLLITAKDISLADADAIEIAQQLIDLSNIDLSLEGLTYTMSISSDYIGRRISIAAILAIGRCTDFGIRYGDYLTTTNFLVNFDDKSTKSFVVDISLEEYSTTKACELKNFYRRFEHNTTFPHPFKRCLDCTCLDGTIICEREQCMRLPCNNTMVMEGDCCPKCAAQTICKDRNSEAIYKPGETAYFDREAGSCVECLCEGNGAFKCESKGCPRLSCLNIVQPTTSCCPVCAKDIKCKHPVTGKLYKAGEKWQNGANGCLKCTCNNDGVIECTRPKCPKITCDSTILQGYCCPVCVDHLKRLPGAATASDYVRIMKPSFLGTEIAERSSSCQDPSTDKVYSVGETWSDNCMRYMCTEDGLTAADVPCPRLVCQEKDRIKVPGSCCSICRDTEIATIQCLQDQMIVYLPRSVLEPVPISKLSLLDNKCGGSQNATHFMFNTTLMDCGTTVTSSGGSIRYANKITTMALNGRNGMVTRVAPVELPFSCVYRRLNKMVLPTAFRPRISQPQVIQESAGEFNLNIELTNSVGNRLDASSVMDINVGEKIYVHVTGQGLKSNGVRVSVRKCFVTPSFDPADPVNHTLIDDGCAVDETVRFLPSNDDGQRFSFDSFLFTHHMESLFYIHCTSVTCDKMDPNSFCASGCQNARMARRKRSIENHRHYPSDLSATIGFLH